MLKPMSDAATKSCSVKKQRVETFSAAYYMCFRALASLFGPTLGFT